MATHSISPLNPDRGTFTPGSVLENRFVIQRLIGIGGMGEVYEAEDLRLDRARIALKTIRSDSFSNQTMRARFQQEVLCARSISHPNICPVYELFTTTWAERGEVWFLTMKLLLGETLQARLKTQPPLSEADKLSVAGEIAAALDELHRAQIIHRDLKPGNVFLEACAQRTRVVVMDFGLARNSSQDASQSTAIVGTPRYMAPELFLGRGATPASDIYALGVLLNDLLLETSAPLDSNAPTQSLANLRFSRAALDVIHRCMDAKPEKRFPSAGAAVDALQQALRPAPFSISRRSALLGTGAALLAAAEGAWLTRDFASDLFHPVPRPRRVAVLPDLHPSADSSLLNGVLENVSGRLTRSQTAAEDLFVVPPRLLRQQNVTEGWQAAGLFGVNLVLQASLQKTASALSVVLSLAHSASGQLIRKLTVVCQPDSAYQLADLAGKGAARLIGLSQSAVATPMVPGNTTNSEAYTAYLSARTLFAAQGLSNIDAAIVELRKAISLDDRFAKAWAELGRYYSARFSLTHDAASLPLAERHIAKALELAPNLAAAHAAEAGVMANRGNYENAVKSMEIAVKLDPADTEAQLILAHIYVSWGKLDRADRIYQQLLESRPNDWTPLNDWASIYFRRANYSRSEELFREATIAAPNAALPWRNLGAVYLISNHFDEAQQALDKSLNLSPSGEAYANRGTALFWLNRYSDAARCYQAAVEINPRRYELWRNLGDAYHMISSVDGSAAKAWRKATELARSDLAQNPRNIDALISLALCEAKLGNSTVALNLLAKASPYGPLDTEQTFNEALVYEVAGERETAIKLLRDCVKRGYSRFEIEHAPELQALRKDSRFKQLAVG